MKINKLLSLVALSFSGLALAQEKSLATLVNEKDAFLVDVRSEKEFDAGSAAHAVNIPLEKIEKELSAVTQRLQSIDLKQSVKELTTSSLQLLKSKVSKRYDSGDARCQFTIRDFKLKTEAFLKELRENLYSLYRKI